MEIKLGIAKLVDEALSSREQKTRDYMGASILGTECDRQLWYKYKMPKPVTDPKLQRIFDFGHILEDYIIKILREAGIQVFEKHEDGEQFGFIDGVIAGHIDGVVVGLPESSQPHLFEAKSANDKRFKEFVKKGVQNVSPEYWAQVHIYMMKMNLTRCLFVMINKNTSELYFERIELDKATAEIYLLRGKEIANAQRSEDTRRKYRKPTHFKCKWCDYATECWATES